VERHLARFGLRSVRRANSSFKHCRLSCSFSSCFPESMQDSGLNCVPSVRQTPAFPIGFPLEGSQLLQILPRSLSERSFLEAALRRLVRCIGAVSLCFVATAWNGKLLTPHGRSLRLPCST